VTKLCTFAGSLIGGYAGWALAESYGIFVALLASGAGSVVGVYLGWKLARKIEG
jgi:membrane protein YqaA with SNARE-associated domain